MLQVQIKKKVNQLNELVCIFATLLFFNFHYSTNFDEVYPRPYLCSFTDLSCELLHKLYASGLFGFCWYIILSYTGLLVNLRSTVITRFIFSIIYFSDVEIQQNNVQNLCFALSHLKKCARYTLLF